MKLARVGIELPEEGDVHACILAVVFTREFQQLRQKQTFCRRGSILPGLTTLIVVSSW